MKPGLLSNEQGRELSGSWNWNGNWWRPRGRIGTLPSGLSWKKMQNTHFSSKLKPRFNMKCSYLLCVSESLLFKTLCIITIEFAHEE